LKNQNGGVKLGYAPKLYERQSSYYMSDNLNKYYFYLFKLGLFEYL